jgi:hypothetical protein
LSIHAASTAALFLIETWQRKFPARPLLHAQAIPKGNGQLHPVRSAGLCRSWAGHLSFVFEGG